MGMTKSQVVSLLMNSQYYKQGVSDVLDKIRAEVESIERYGTNNGKDLWLRTPEEIKEDVLTIIDKYKAESEEQA